MAFTTERYRGSDTLNNHPVMPNMSEVFGRPKNSDTQAAPSAYTLVTSFCIELRSRNVDTDSGRYKFIFYARKLAKQSWSSVQMTMLYNQYRASRVEDLFRPISISFQNSSLNKLTQRDREKIVGYIIQHNAEERKKQLYNLNRCIN